MNDASHLGTQDSDDGFHFSQWVEDCQGRDFCIEWQKELGMSGPAFVYVAGGPAVQRLLGVLNKGLARVQQPSRSYESFELAVTRRRGDREELVLEESFDGVEGVRGRAGALISQIQNGNFEPEEA